MSEKEREKEGGIGREREREEIKQFLFLGLAHLLPQSPARLDPGDQAALTSHRAAVPTGTSSKSSTVNLVCYLCLFRHIRKHLHYVKYLFAPAVAHRRPHPQSKRVCMYIGLLFHCFIGHPVANRETNLNPRFQFNVGIGQLLCCDAFALNDRF